jgi:hypothetical protein
MGGAPDGWGCGRSGVQPRGEGVSSRNILEETDMKTNILAAAAFAGLAFSPLFAQPAAAPTPPSTRAEMEQSIQARFATRDANHDGFLTADELGESGPMAIARLDADHDGKISLAEARTAMLAMFDRVDTNHDGVVSPEERAAAEAQMGQPAPQPAQQPAPQPAPQPN